MSGQFRSLAMFYLCLAAFEKRTAAPINKNGLFLEGEWCSDSKMSPYWRADLNEPLIQQYYHTTFNMFQKKRFILKTSFSYCDILMTDVSVISDHISQHMLPQKWMYGPFLLKAIWGSCSNQTILPINKVYFLGLRFPESDLLFICVKSNDIKISMCIT